MTENTFTPGPTPNSVRSADGKVLTAPDGWTLLPPGDAALTAGAKPLGIIGLFKRRRDGSFSQGAFGRRQPQSIEFVPTLKPSDPPRATPNAESPTPDAGTKLKPNTSKTSTEPW